MCEIPALTPFPEVAGCETFEQSLDLSRFPNLQEVRLAVRIGWREGGLPWVPWALSTLRPATSPRLSAIRVSLGCLAAYHNFAKPLETLVNDTTDDLRRIADEVTRIKHEFGGAVKFTVFRDTKFQAVFDRINVSFPLRDGQGPSVTQIDVDPSLPDFLRYP